MLKLQRDFNCKKSEPETQKSFSVDLIFRVYGTQNDKTLHWKVTEACSRALHKVTLSCVNICNSIIVTD